MLRAATPADVPAIEAIVQRAYAVYLPRMGQPPGPMLDDYRALAAQGRVTVADDAWRIVGLMAFAEEEARRRGLPEIRLYTHVTMTENIALYGRLGFVETHRGEQAGYSRVFMRKPLLP